MRRSLEQSENIQKFNERIAKIRQDINETKSMVLYIYIFIVMFNRKMHLDKMLMQFRN